MPSIKHNVKKRNLAIDKIVQAYYD